jgi:hypothetical protein
MTTDVVNGSVINETVTHIVRDSNEDAREGHSAFVALLSIRVR